MPIPSFYAQEMVKEARIYGSLPLTPNELSWSDKYKGTPFYQEAAAIEKEDALLDVEDAKRECERQQEYADDSQFRAKTSALEARLIQWRYEQMGFTKKASAGMAKLACLSMKACHYSDTKEWSDGFKGTPFYDAAVALEIEDAKREAAKAAADQGRHNPKRSALRVRRAKLEARYLEWKAAPKVEKTAEVTPAVYQKVLQAAKTGKSLVRRPPVPA